jgi:hypothetical protein
MKREAGSGIEPVRNRRGSASSAVKILLSLLSWPTPSMSRAVPSRVLLVRVRDGGERALLADLTRIATLAGLECRPKPTTTYDGKPEPNPGIDCFFPHSVADFRGDLSAVGLLAQKAVFLRILSNNVSTPNGDVDPVIDQVLREFEQGFAGSNRVRSFEECRAPEFQRCVLE